jgi:hypothetical protein
VNCIPEFPNLSRGSEEKYEKLRQVAGLGPRFEAGTSLIRSRIAKSSVAVFLRIILIYETVVHLSATGNLGLK